MLRIIQNSNSAGVKSYYSSADYFSEGREAVGMWRGRGAAFLGLAGAIARDDWDALCDNRDPRSSATLTVRRRQERRVGYDFNFNAPKSLSVYYALTGDESVPAALRAAAGEAMVAVEAEMKTRVRTGGRDEDRTTGNLVWGEYLHSTSRPVDGVPDPQLHVHCFAFNTTWDSQESRWKAGQFRDLKRDAPYFEALFHASLAHRLFVAGLPIERTRRGWEIAGIPRGTLRKFSRRTAQIEALAEARGIRDAREKDRLGATSRQRKSRQLSWSELRETWASRVTNDERAAVQAARERSAASALNLGEAVDHALDHCFERSAVVPERTVQAEALKRSYGGAAPAATLHELARRDLLGGERDGRRFVTTRAVLAEEQRMLDFARAGRGACPPLAPGPHRFAREWLNAGQRSAVLHVLHAPDRVLVVRGAAGVGKTSMMQEAVEAIQATGRRVSVFAPSADASRGVLRSEGFEHAETVARLLVDAQLQSQARDGVLWIDEAGQLGTRTMGRVFELADRLHARVVLSGDRRQHGAVERGAALRLLEEQAGVRPAEILEIQRQKGEYRRAVQALSEGRVSDGFRLLDGLGWIREAPAEQRYALIAREYVAARSAGKSALVVSPTHLEGEWITAGIRAAMRDAGRLRPGERTFDVLESADLTQAERADAVNYLPGDVVVYHQNARGVRSGARRVVGRDEVNFADAPRFQAYRPRTLTIAPGEVIRITRNGKTADGRHAVSNGGLFTVQGFTPQGDIQLAAAVGAGGRTRPLSGWVIARDYGHLDYGYVVTSHASQGKTVDRVIIGQSAASSRAASREGFYVSVSRGREQALVITDDKHALREAVSAPQDHPTATEFITDAERRARARTIARLDDLAERSITPAVPARTDRTYHPDRMREHTRDAPAHATREDREMARG